MLNMEALQAMGLTPEQAQETLAEVKAQVLAVRKESAIQMALATAKARNAKAVLALMDVDGLEMQEDGTLQGLTQAIEGLRKTDGYLFEDAAAPPAGGFNPAAPPQSGNADVGLHGAVSAYYKQTI